MLNMGILKKRDTKKIFFEAGCWYTKGIQGEIDNLIQSMLENIAKKSSNILKSMKKKKLTKEALELAYDQYLQEKAKGEILKLMSGLQKSLEKDTFSKG